MNAANDSTDVPRCPVCDSTQFTSVHQVPLAMSGRTERQLPAQPSEGVRCMCGLTWHITSLVGPGYTWQRSELARLAKVQA